MNYSRPLPEEYKGEPGHVTSIKTFLDGLPKGFFLREDVMGFWATDTHFDPEGSVWTVPQPSDATKVVLFAAPEPSRINFKATL